VNAIGKIMETINQINDASTTIASAVEEQSATTMEIGRSVGEAAQGSNEIADTIATVATAAEATMQGANNSLESAEELSHLANELQTLVSKYQI